MPTVIQNALKYVSKKWIYTLRLIVVLGLGVFFFYFGSFVFHKSFEFLNSNGNNLKSFKFLNINGSHSQSFNLALNTTADPTVSTLCIITRIYWAQISYFPILAFGLYHSGLHNIRIYITNTDRRTDIRQLEQTIKFINELVLRQDLVTLLDLGEPPVANDYGYGMTDRALTYLYKQHLNSSSICQYVTFTNGDNFYSRSFGKKLLPHMKAGKDIIAWGFISHHVQPRYKESIDDKKQTVPQVVDDGTAKCIPVELRWGYADLGAVAYRVSFLQKHNLYFKPSGGDYSFGSDGYFVEQAASRTNASIILKQTLLVHQ